MTSVARQVLDAIEAHENARDGHRPKTFVLSAKKFQQLSDELDQAGYVGDLPAGQTASCKAIAFDDVVILSEEY